MEDNIMIYNHVYKAKKLDPIYSNYSLNAVFI